MMSKKLLALLLTLGSMSGCASFNPSVDFPDEMGASTKPAGKQEMRIAQEDPNSAQFHKEMAMARNQSTDGSLFNSSTYSGLFEDRRARQVGDLLTIVVQESIDSQQQNETSVSRRDDISLRTPEIRGFFNLRGIDGSATSDKDFSGEGATRANNRVTGTVAVVVTEVLPSGNLRVKGERQIGTNREVEYIKFYGIVNPETIRSGNRVASTEVAEARIEYRGRGQVDSAQAMGWMSRFFLSVMPF